MDGLDPQLQAYVDANGSHGVHGEIHEPEIWGDAVNAFVAVKGPLYSDS